MALTVEIKHPDFPDDTEFDVAGVLIPNGGSVELTEDQERLLVARRLRPAKDVLEGNQFVKVKGSPLLSKKDLDEILPTYVGEVVEHPVEEVVEGSDA